MKPSLFPETAGNCCRSDTGHAVLRCGQTNEKGRTSPPGLPFYRMGRKAYAPAICSRSTFTPGPMVELTETFFTNLPFAPDGLFRIIASMNAVKFSLRSPSEKLALP